MTVRPVTRVARPVGRRPHDHIGWAFDGPDEFDRAVTAYFVEGLARGERLSWIVEEPQLGRLRGLGDVATLVDEGVLTVLAVADAYGDGTDLDCAALPLRMRRSAAAAAAAGFTGVRAAADVTGLVAATDGGGRWLRWEAAADRGIADNPVTGLCGYDRRRIGDARRAELAALHSVVSSDHRDVGFRLLATPGTAGGVLQLVGEVDGLCLARFERLLSGLGAPPVVVVDLGPTGFVSHGALVALHRWAGAVGTEVVLRGARPVHRTLWRLLALEPSALRFEEGPAGAA